MEIWKDVAGYQGLYQVSNLGMVKKMWKKVYGPIVLLLALFAALLTMLCLAGCTATKSVTITYDADGHIVSRMESQESVVKTITASTAGKTVIAWESGWAVYISGSTATEDDPTPHVKMFAGKTDKGIVSAIPTQTGWDGIAEVVRATKYELRVTPDGVSSIGEQPAEKQ